MRDFKRVLVWSDTHCGHELGLTHPDFDAIPTDTSSKKYENYLIRRRMWAWATSNLDELKPIDILIFNGDAIEGKGEKSGGTELITSDRTEQVDMATAAIEEVGAEEIYMSYGTPYHAGRWEDWEDLVAKQVKAKKIGGEDSLSVGWQEVPEDGLIFNYRHKVGKSTLPHSRATAVLKEKLWNGLWAARGEYPKANIIIRSHVHYMIAVLEPGESLSLVTPALQAYGSKFGGRQCTGEVHFGFCWLDVWTRSKWEWKFKVMKLKRSQEVLLAASQ